MWTISSFWYHSVSITAMRSPSEGLPWGGAGGRGVGQDRWVRTACSHCSVAHTHLHTVVCLAQVGVVIQGEASSPETSEGGDKWYASSINESKNFALLHFPVAGCQTWITETWIFIFYKVSLVLPKHLLPHTHLVLQCWSFRRAVFIFNLHSTCILP